MISNESEPVAMKSKLRRCRVTPEWLLVGVLMVEGIAFFSHRFRSFAEMNVWPILLAMGSVVVATLLILLWLASNLVFHRHFRFSFRAMLLLAVFAALPGTWLVVGGIEKKEESEAVERAMAADRDDKPSYEAFKIAHTFPYSAPSERKNQITENYSRLRIGLSKADVATILGDPDCSDQMRSKGPRDEYIGTAWTYYLEKPNPNLVNLKHDKTVEVFFDPKGKVHWVVSNVEGLAEIGGPGR